MNEVVSALAEWAGVAKNITIIAGAVALVATPLLGIRALKEGLKCLLRSEILHIYYRHQDTCTLRQYEYENLIFCYKAYKALKGNSFVDHIFKEVENWNVHS